MVKYKFNGFTPRKEKDKGELVVYLHRRKDNNEVFYVGEGTFGRSKNTHSRSYDWFKIVDEAGGRTVEYIAEKGSKSFVKGIEEWCIAVFRGLGCNLVNKNKGGCGRKAGYESSLKGKYGVEVGATKGFLRLYNNSMKLYLVVCGANQMIDLGFDPSHIYACKNDKNKSTGSRFFADSDGFRMRFSVAGYFATIEDASDVPNDWKIAYKNTTCAREDASLRKKGKFKGVVIGVDDKSFVIAIGGHQLTQQGFNQTHASKVIHGERPHHKGFVFFRINDPEELIELCSNYLEDGYEFHHELSEQNFMMLCED